jgi:geranylgeranyl diphosphate synthase type II
MSLGGKRIRPALTVMAAEMFDIPKEESIHAALAIEFFHNFSLIHDDIMDEAPLRRGKSTVHEKWNTSVAILSGDALFIESYQSLIHYPDDRLPILLKRFNETAVEVCEGQQMDMDFENRTNVTVEQYLHMIRLKTSVLLGCALEFGAILGRQNEETCSLLYNLGVSLGLAFQIQDDILDLYADPLKFGKQVGGDVLANKKTMLLIEALSTNDNRVAELIAMSATEQKVEVAKKLFTDLGCLEIVKQKKEYFHKQADDAIETLEKSGKNTSELKKLAEFLLMRDV